MREDWIEVQLKEICSYSKGKKPKVLAKEFSEKTPYPYVNIKAFEQGIFDEYTDGNKCNLCDEGDLLMVWDGARAGFTGKAKKGAIGSTLMKIKEREGIQKNYLFYFLLSLYKKLNTNPRGVGIPHVEPSLLWTSELIVTSLPEQRAIVKKIETLFASLDKGIADLKNAQEQLKVYRQAVLKKAFEGEFTKDWRAKNPYSQKDFLNELKKEKSEAIKSKLIAKDEYFPEFSEKEMVYKMPDNWLCLPWKTLTSNNKYAMKRGPFGSALKKEFFVDNGYVVYEQGHAINDEPYRHRYFITPEKYEEMKAFSVKGGDMIISCSGVTLGRICLLPNDADDGIINQALLKIDLDEKIMLKNYFVMLFRSETFQRLIFGKSLGTAMPNMVGMPELKHIPIPVPSINEQKQIIKEIETRLSVCDKVEQSISEALEKAEALRQSILKKAFEGKLLSEDEIAKCKRQADYEPASELLKRIRAEKK